MLTHASAGDWGRTMATHDAARLLLLYAHFLLAVFALERVLHADWRLLHGRLTKAELAATHRALIVLLPALWVTGAAIVALDVHGDWMLLLGRPKLLAKLATVAVLTANGVVLHGWCFPRMTSATEPSRGALAVIAVAGAVSTTSWLMAAFYGIAKPLQAWPVVQCLALYGFAVGAAVIVALVWMLVAPPHLKASCRRTDEGFRSLPRARSEHTLWTSKALARNRRDVYLGSTEAS